MSEFQNLDAARVLPDGKTYSDAEVQDIYKRAAQIQSKTELGPSLEWDSQTLEEGANRAGISDAALLAAIKERETEIALARQNEKTVKIRAAQTRRILAVGAALVAVATGISVWSASRALAPAHAQVAAQRAQIDNVLQRRHDLIPNLLAVTRDTLQNQRQLVAALENANRAAQQNRDLAAQAQLSQPINAALLQLQRESNSPLVSRVCDQMEGAENRIAQERRRYNEAVANYNQKAGGLSARVWHRVLGYPAQHAFFPMDEKAREAPRY